MQLKIEMIYQISNAYVDPIRISDPAEKVLATPVQAKMTDLTSRRRSNSIDAAHAPRRELFGEIPHDRMVIRRKLYIDREIIDTIAGAYIYTLG
jgi:hypothetical protein